MQSQIIRIFAVLSNTQDERKHPSEPLYLPNHTYLSHNCLPVKAMLWCKTINIYLSIVYMPPPYPCHYVTLAGRKASLQGDAPEFHIWHNAQAHKRAQAHKHDCGATMNCQ